MLPFSLENCSKMMLKINWFLKKLSMGVAFSRLWAPPLKRMCAQTYAIFFTVFAGITIKSRPSPRQMSQNQCHFSTCKYSNLVKHAWFYCSLEWVHGLISYFIFLNFQAFKQQSHFKHWRKCFCWSYFNPYFVSYFVTRTAWNCS